MKAELNFFELYRELSPYLHKYRWRILLGLALSTFAALLNAASPFFLRQAIDKVQAHQQYQTYIFLILASAGASGFLTLFMRRLIGISSRYIEYDIRRDLFRHLLSLDAYFYGKTRIGDLVNKFNTDLGAVREMLGQGLNMGWRIMMFALFAFIAMYTVSWKLALVLTLVIPIIFAIFRYLLKMVDRRYRESQEIFDQISAKAQENFSGIRVVKGFALEERELEAFQRLNRGYITKSLALARVEGPMRALMGLLIGLTLLIVLWLGGGMVIRGELTVGQMVQFNSYIVLLSWPIIGMGWLLSLFQRAATSYQRVKAIFGEAPTIADPKKPAEVTLSELGGEVRFNKVSLQLGGYQQLEEITLTIPSGTTLGITGRTGAGKTLLVNLIPRLLNPSQGDVMLGGHKVNELPLSTLRQAVGVVPQEPFLFSDTISENIAFGLPEVDQERVEWAAKLAGVHDDIVGFPKGYQTSLGERGVTLSGGQRQRTALARALARRPKVLILDDALSAVDTETESRILSGLKSMLGQQTTILIAHRTSTLRYADWIVVLDKGKIVEEGSHEMLLDQGGLYAELDRIQRLEAEVE